MVPMHRLTPAPPKERQGDARCDSGLQATPNRPPRGPEAQEGLLSPTIGSSGLRSRGWRAARSHRPMTETTPQPGDANRASRRVHSQEAVVPRLRSPCEGCQASLHPPNGPVAQLPAGVPLWHRIRLTLSSAAYASLRKLGVNERFVYETLRLSPIRMNSMREGEVVAYLESLGASVLRVENRTEIGLPQSRAYFVTK